MKDLHPHLKKILKDKYNVGDPIEICAYNDNYHLFATAYYKDNKFFVLYKTDSWVDGTDFSENRIDGYHYSWRFVSKDSMLRCAQDKEKIRTILAINPNIVDPGLD